MLDISLKSILLGCGLYALSLQTVALPTAAEKEFEYDGKQSATAVELIYRLYQNHYSKRRLDDTLSADFLDRYLRDLDPARLYFYAADIDKFQQHRAKFDDYFREGNLDVVYDIYEVYQDRVSARLEALIELLRDETVNFTFTTDESMELDRENAPWIRSTSEANQLWHKRLKWNVLSLKMSGDTVAEAREKLAKRFSNQLHRLQQEKSQDVLETVLNSLTLLYDPHTNYWSPRTTENFNINMSKSLEGIGAVLQSEDEFTKVIRLVAGGPAAKQGQLKAADRIVAVGQGEAGELVDITGWRIDDVVDLIRGPKGTVVRLAVRSSSDIEDVEKIVLINRGKVTLEDQSAQKAVLELPASDGDTYKLGVIQLPDFYQDFEAMRLRDPNAKSSTRDVRRLLAELMSEGIDGLILDLRNNGGGSLLEATMLTDLFIDRGVVVQIKSSDGRVSRQNQARTRPFYDGPLVVMVNRLSASASEIFAGAIQDYGRGLIVGSRSFGKGTVQSVNDLKLGQLKITESKFYRVSGESTQHRGVIPDILFPSVIDEEEVGESAYDNALPWDQIHAVPHAVYYDFSPLLPQLKQAHDKRAKQDPDLVYFEDRIALIESNRDKKTLSLNESQRKQDKEMLETKAMALANKRRSAKGLEPFKDLAAYRANEEKEEADASNFGLQKIDVDGDALLIESGNVLVDLINAQIALSKEKQLANIESSENSNNSGGK